MTFGRRSGALIFVLLVVLAGAEQPDRYRELKRVVDRNVGYAHMTRGMNMYTLVAVRGCVKEKDIPVLGAMLDDKDRIVRMTAANVLVDLGQQGKHTVQAKLQKIKDASEGMMLQEALDDAAKPDYRPILEYPLNDRERSRIHGCRK